MRISFYDVKQWEKACGHEKYDLEPRVVREKHRRVKIDYSSR